MDSAGPVGLDQILRQKLIYYMQYYLGDVENIFYVIAALLDSRFKTASFSTNENIECARDALIEEAAKCVSNDDVSTSTDISQDLNDSNKNDSHISLWSCFGTEVANINEHVSSA